ncbi:hypothetical protein J7J62_01950 [bacterium]|nr:hypothetical protein [bacterium]
MAAYLIGYEKGKGETESFLEIAGQAGNYCVITSSLIFLDSELEFPDIISRFSRAIDDNGVLFVLDLDTMEVDGINLPDCIDEFLMAAEEANFNFDDELDEGFADEGDEGWGSSF